MTQKMTQKMTMKTPDEIKKGLECCSEDGCKGCPFEEDCMMADGFSVLAYDALEYIRQLEDGIDRCYKLAKDINVPRWISVFDVIPEKFKDVLACDGNGMGIVQFFGDNKPYEMREDGWTEVEVHYWMPIPEPPKED